MNRKAFYIGAGIVGALLLISGTLLYWQRSAAISPKKPAVLIDDSAMNQEVKVTVGVDYALSKATSSGEVFVKEGSNVLGSLRKAHEVKTKKYSFGEMVEAIDGVVGEKGKFWIYYVNGETAKVGADQQRVAVGDKILWRLEAEK